MAEEQGLTVDKTSYEEAMKAQQLQSGAAKKASQSLNLEAAETSELKSQGVSPTDDSSKYGSANTACVVKAIFVHAEGDLKGKFVTETSGADGVVGIITDKTSYYAESGGQTFDTGTVSDGTSTVTVTNTQVFGGYVMHMGNLEGTMKVGAEVSTAVDYERRTDVVPNHTMTHILNYALRKVLTGQVIDQRGSFVGAENLRFDFSCSKALDAKQLAAVEGIVQAKIEEGLDVHIQVSPLEQAKRIGSLRAVFGETYPDPVRVVSVGNAVQEMLDDPENPSFADLSVEFCGGTHLTNTKQAGGFAIVDESAVTKGVRRMAAVTGKAAAACAARAVEFQKVLDAAAAMSDADLVAEVSKLGPQIDGLIISQVTKNGMRTQYNGQVDRVKKHKKKAAAARAKSAVGDCTKLAEKALADGAEFTVTRLDVGVDAKIGRAMVDAFAKAHPDGSFMVWSSDMDAGKTACTALCSKKHQEAGKDARKWVTAAVEKMGGKGGGKDASFAVGQCKTVEGIDAGMELGTAYWA